MSEARPPSLRFQARWQSLHAARQALVLGLLLALPDSSPNPAQSSHQFPGQLSRSGAGSTMQMDETNEFEEEKRLRLLNADRQKSLVSDTGKLLKLANELDGEIAGANAESLTPAQLRKVAEIEKLARSIKEKMSTSVRSTPVFRQPAPPEVR
jgi:hypothetical protein